MGRSVGAILVLLHAIYFNKMKNKVLVLSASILTLVCIISLAFFYVKGQKTARNIALTAQVEKLSVISQRLEDAQKGSGTAVYQLKNEADVPIVAITFESDDRRSQFHRIATIDGNNERKVLALAQITFEIRMPLDQGVSYSHIVAVVYADGTVSGREDAAKNLKQIWEEAYKEAGERLQ